MQIIRVNVQSAKVSEAFARMPAAMELAIDPKLDRAAQEVARLEKQFAPKAFSTLANSIRSRKVFKLHYRVETGVNYAAAVEDGGHPKRMPPPDNLMAWIRQHAPALPGSRSERSRAWGLAKYILRHGTKPHPYAAPAVEAGRSRVFELAAQGVSDGLQKVFG